MDMNLSPTSIGRLARHGSEGVHWSTIGALTAPDDEILAWAREHRFVVITNDLDFAAILAATSGQAPSVVASPESRPSVRRGCQCGGESP